MSQGPSNTDPSSFETWLERTAAEREMEKEEVLRQLVSAFWTLDEISQLLERQREADGPGTAATSQKSLLSESPFEEFEPASTGPPMDDQHDVLETRIDELEQMSDELLAHQESIESDVEELTRIVSGLADAVSESATEEHGDDLEQAVKQIAALEQKTDSISDRLDEEFSNIRTIIEHLFATMNDFKGRIATVEERTNTLDSWYQRQQQLQELRQQASQAGVRKAVCDECDAEVDLLLLASPSCPHCGESFHDLEVNSGLFNFDNNRLLTEAKSETSQQDEPASSDLQDLSEATSDANTGVLSDSDPDLDDSSSVFGEGDLAETLKDQDDDSDESEDTNKIARDGPSPEDAFEQFDDETDSEDFDLR